MTQQVDISTDQKIASLVDRIGALPDAPLTMPKQRLESERGGMLAWLGGAMRLGVSDTRRTGR